MSIRHLTTLMLLGAIALGGCNRQAPKTEEPATSEATPAGEAAAEPGVISLEADSQRLIGLQTATVGFAQVDATLSTTGEIASNADREAHVTTRVPGRVLSVRKGVGDWARAGETIAVLESVELGQAQAEYLQSEAKQDLASSTYERQRQLFADKLTAKKEVQAAANELRLARIDTERDANQLLEPRRCSRPRVLEDRHHEPERDGPVARWPGMSEGHRSAFPHVFSSTIDSSGRQVASVHPWGVPIAEPAQ